MKLDDRTTPSSPVKAIKPFKIIRNAKRLKNKNRQRLCSLNLLLKKKTFSPVQQPRKLSQDSQLDIVKENSIEFQPIHISTFLNAQNNDKPIFQLNEQDQETQNLFIPWASIHKSQFLETSQYTNQPNSVLVQMFQNEIRSTCSSNSGCKSLALEISSSDDQEFQQKPSYSVANKNPFDFFESEENKCDIKIQKSEESY